MTYHILLNETRKEAFLVSDGDKAPNGVLSSGQSDLRGSSWNEVQTIHLTKLMKPYMNSIKSWSFADDIKIYITDQICYHTLEEYNELNFMSYNKEAIFLTPKDRAKFNTQ